MEITFANPGIDYMIEHILAFQTEDESAFWSEPLFFFYKQLDKEYADSLDYTQRKKYIESTLRAVYPEIEGDINGKVLSYAEHWRKNKAQITEAFSDAFETDCSKILNSVRCNITMNPIEPRFLTERIFDVFYLNSERGALGESLHELTHFVWFHVWNRTFNDSYDEYERPSMKWILSEMVVESIMKDPRLSSLNPYFQRENGGCIYPYFFDMRAGGKLILETVDEMYRSMGIQDFMKTSFTYCLEHEKEIREHIEHSENG